MTEHESAAEHKHLHTDVTVEVYAPKEIKPKGFTWAKSTLVGVAAAEAANAFDYHATEPSFKAPNKVVLNRQETLEQAGVHENEHLDLVAAGGGVSAG